MGSARKKMIKGEMSLRALRNDFLQQVTVTKTRASSKTWAFKAYIVKEQRRGALRLRVTKTRRVRSLLPEDSTWGGSTTRLNSYAGRD